MRAFAVKHIAKKQGPLTAILESIKESPYSYTSKEPEASDAALGNDVYVIEVRSEKTTKTYWLGYKYRAYAKLKPAGGGLWIGKFKFRNSAMPGLPAKGEYFDAPTQITDTLLCDWLRARTFGMTEIPTSLISKFDDVISNIANAAKRFS